MSAEPAASSEAARAKRAAPEPAPRARPRVGFLGVGWIGRNRMEAVLGSGSVEIAAIVDSDGKRARDAAALCPGAACGDDPTLLFDCDLDGVVIATPSALHAEQCRSFLSRGVSVFCQKPLGRTARETEGIVDEARKRDRLLATDFCYRRVAGMDAMRDLARSGDLGDVVLVDAVFHNAYGPDKPWFHDPSLSGGGCLMDLGIHLLDLSAWVLDFPAVARVTSCLHARGERLLGRRDRVEDHALADLELGSGGVIRLACSWNLHAGRDAVIGLAIYGTKGGTALRNRNGSFYDFMVERFRGTAREVLAGPSADWQGLAVREWAERLGRSPRFDPEAERLVDVAELLDLAYEADGIVGGVEPRARSPRT